MQTSATYSIAFIGEHAKDRQNLIRSITREDPEEPSTTDFSTPRDFSFALGESHLHLRLFDVQEDDFAATQANLVVLVSSSSDNLHDQWISKATELKKPFLVVRVISSPTATPTAEKDYEYPLGCVGSIEFDEESEEGTENLVFKLCEACLHPLAPLYKFDTQSISPRCIAALRRVFWIVDSDNDRFWNSLELNRFLRICSDSFSTLESANALISREDDSLVHDSGMSLEGLVAFVSQLIKQQKISLVWTILRCFNYDDRLTLDIEDTLHEHVPTCTVEECITLSEQGVKVLTDLFHKFDRNGDKLLDKEEIEEVFSITAENPLEKLSSDYMEMCETKKGSMTLNGWISLWCLLTVRDPYTLLRTLVYWGIKKNLGRVFIVKKKRGFRDAENAMKADTPTTIQCYIFGSPGAGKLNLMRSFVKKPSDSTYRKADEQYAVANIINFEDVDYCLTITEFEYGQVQTVLASEDLMSQCDVCMLCFDGNDKYSFSTVAFIQKHLPRNMPVVYFLTKSDLEIVDQEFEVTPQEFCQELQLPWPCILSSLVKDDQSKIQQNFQEVVASAIYPDIAVPNFDAEEDSDADDDEDEDIGSKRTDRKGNALLKTMIGLGTAAVLGFVAWRVLKNKNVDASGKQS